MRDSKLPKRQGTDEFKVETSRLAESVGGDESARRWGVPVATLGNWKWRVQAPNGRTLANQALDAKVAVIHREIQRSYGRARITQQLRRQGECVTAERVRRSLKRQGLRPVYRQAHVVTTDSNHRLPVAPNLLDRRVDGWQPNQAWVDPQTAATLLVTAGDKAGSPLPVLPIRASAIYICTLRSFVATAEQRSFEKRAENNAGCRRQDGRRVLNAGTNRNKKMLVVLKHFSCFSK